MVSCSPMKSISVSTILLAGLVLSFAGCSAKPQFERPLQAVSGARQGSFRQEINAMLGGSVIPGNRIETFNNGNEIFGAMLSAIRGAKQTINFETYVFYKGEIPGQFAEAFIERARAGVQVRVLLDAVGSKKSRPYHSEMRKAGVKLAVYHPIWWFDPRRYNHRTHRKLLI